MKAEKLEKRRNILVESGVINPAEELVEALYAKHLDRANILINWIDGWVYLTGERLIFVSGLTVRRTIIPYKNILRLGKFSMNFLPTGVSIIYENPETGEVVKEKFIIQKRKKSLSFLAEKAGLS